MKHLQTTSCITYNICFFSKGMVIFLGDFNSKIMSNVSLANRDTYFSQFLSDINYVAADTLSLCEGVRVSFVWYDGKIRKSH